VNASGDGGANTLLSGTVDTYFSPAAKPPAPAQAGFFGSQNFFSKLDLFEIVAVGLFILGAAYITHKAKRDME
jgi:hypothetical protein